MNIVRIGKHLAGEVYYRGFREEAEFEQNLQRSSIQLEQTGLTPMVEGWQHAM